MPVDRATNNANQSNLGNAQNTVNTNNNTNNSTEMTTNSGIKQSNTLSAQNEALAQTDIANTMRKNAYNTAKSAAQM
jgi:hypothetical protein